MISTKERAILRGYANNLSDLVYVGKEGITPNVIKQINDNLLAHELIKIKVQPNCDGSAKELVNVICDKCNCEPVSVCGGKIVVYKKTTKQNFKHYL